MARRLNQLTTLDVRRALRQGNAVKLHDGGGLYLHVTGDGTGAGYWFFRYGAGGKSLLSLGPTHTVALADARAKAAAGRKLLLDGRDPKIERETVRAAAKAEAAASRTFDEVAEAYVESHKAGWATPKHAREVRESLRCCGPLASVPVGAVDTTLVLKTLQPLWKAKPDAGRRLRGRIECVIDYAKAAGWCSGENPARWRGHLDKLLPSAGKLHGTKHHKALAYADLPELMLRLRAIDSTAARCLEFLILTASRLQEARGARFDEIDGDTWTVPAARMKRRKQHRVALSGRALEILAHQRRLTNSEFVFPGDRADYVSDGVLGRLLASLDPDGSTVHGFRSTFSDWAGETTDFSDTLVELALAHSIGTPTARAYRRGDRLDQRRPLMAAWAEYCGAAVPLPVAAAA